MRKVLFLLMLLSGAGLRAETPLRIVQLDLARQMETPSFVSNYIDRVAGFGYNAVEFYLEARVGTKTFSLPDGQRYTPAEMKGLVAHAAEKGLVVIPVVSFLGHAEQFFTQPELMPLCETREGKFRLGTMHNTFCHSQPETLKFIESYVADLCEIFPGPYFHAGFDEAWNSGVCSLCAPKEAKDELFAEQIANVYRILRRHGKRMMMWDDFFGFHPKTLVQVPRDVVLMHWNYDTDISDRGARFNFAGRLREDALARYAALGFEAIPCTWYDPDNIRSFVAYARRNRTAGFLQTQWEDLIPNFHGGSLPRVLAASILLDDPSGAQAEDAFPKAVRRLFPSLADIEVAATVRVLEKPADELALGVLEASALARGLGPVADDPLCERALFDDILCRARLAVLRETVAKARRILGDPRRTEADVAAAKRLLASVPSRAEALEKRRAAQSAAWRPGCTPCAAADAPRAVAAEARKLADAAATAGTDERCLEMELTMIDRYGIPRWKVEGLVDGKWIVLHDGVVKPAAGQPATFTFRKTFAAAALPSQVRLGYSGFGDAEIRYLSVADRRARVVPRKVLETSGAVRDAEAVLTDDYSAARVGTFGFARQFRDPAAANAVSSLTVEMVRE